MTSQQPQPAYYQPQQQGQQQPVHQVTIAQSAAAPTVRQGRLLGCGIALLVLGILVFIISCINFKGTFGYAIWGGGLYIAAGALAIAASRQPTQCLVTATKIVSIIASVVAGLATLVYFIWFILVAMTGQAYFIVIMFATLAFSVAVLALAILIACATCPGKFCQ